jgi:hypothetical protein
MKTLRVPRSLIGKLSGFGLFAFALLLGSFVEAKADPVNLGAASGFAVLGIGSNTTISINGGNGVHGNVGGRNNIALDNPSNIFGQVILGSGGSFHSTAQNPVVATQNAALLTQAAADARAAATTAAGLAATNTSILSVNLSNSTGTITGGAMRNVLNLTSVNLNHGTLILSAPAGGSFVLNVSGNFVLNTGSILLSGGLTADDVLINVTGTGSAVAFTGGGNQSVVFGTLLATDRNIQLSPGLVNGRIIGGGNQITLVSGSQANGPAVPEPTTLLLLGTGLAGAALKARRRRKAHGGDTA